MKGGQRFVGLAMREGSIFSCTSNGALRLTQLSPESTEPMSSLASLPMRLCEWRLAQSGQNFAYGGDEVELSIWDTENAFSHKSEVPPSSAESNKRKRGDQLLPGEVWRAKNIPNDHLSLRQPVRNTALTFLQSSSSTAHHDLLVGTASGNVRRYDTRAARRPVADWKAVGKTGGISTVEKGFHDHEVFVADHGCTLSALDVRSGRTIYAYKGISGAVSSVAPAQSFMASTSQDRFVRLHSTFGPPQEVGQQQDHKGDVLDKLYMKVTPTVVVWDDRDAIGLATPDQEEEGGDDVWDTMQAVESDDEDDGRQESRKEKKTRKE
ncbi:hypothetical protein C8Q80DRAFT_709953 [Daedaleopsis nitida]|nr:hypothetical protein C8Q80DRAFT_709953 [Daedaleopsis nitida]